MQWRVALIDSCGEWPGAVAAAAFVDESAVAACASAQPGSVDTGARGVSRCAAVADATGHGSRVAQLLSDGGAQFDLLLGQVLLENAPASAAAVAAAVDWAVAGGANLIHMSLGLAADRAVLAAAVSRAVEAGCVVVASAPARGAVVYPAAYPGVIRGTGDARCAPGELSCLGPEFFGACPRWLVSGAGIGAGSSIGAAWVTRTILSEPTLGGIREAIERATAKVVYWGPERRS
jgi:hypothetical protein